MEGDIWSQSVKLFIGSSGEDGIRGELVQVADRESSQVSAASVREQAIGQSSRYLRGGGTVDVDGDSI